MGKLSPQSAPIANQMSNYLTGWIETWAYKKFRLLPHRFIGFFTGNQSMKTSSGAFHYVERIFSLWPVPKKNIFYYECETRNKDNLAPHGYFTFVDRVTGTELRGWEKGTWTIPRKDTSPRTGVHALPANGRCPYCDGKVVPHWRKSRIIRFAAESLPTDKGSTGAQSKEIKNSVYPEFKRWLPDWMIKRDKSGKAMDITIRNPSITIVDPNEGRVFFENEGPYRGDDIVVEFVSYNQETQAGAGVQRVSCWLDEHAPLDFYEEQLPRLLAEDGDMLLTLTPAMGINWEYDDIFEKAETYIRTQAVCDFL